MPTYKQRPTKIEAIQWNRENLDKIKEFVKEQWEYWSEEIGIPMANRPVPVVKAEERWLHIQQKPGWSSIVAPGNYVYFCTKSLDFFSQEWVSFEARYEEAGVDVIE